MLFNNITKGTSFKLWSSLWPITRGRLYIGDGFPSVVFARKEAPLHLLPPRRRFWRLRGGMQIYVKTLDDRTITLGVGASGTISAVKDYSIQSESTLRLALRLVGMPIFIKTPRGKSIIL